MKNRRARRVLKTMAAAVTGIAMACVAAFGQATISEAEAATTLPTAIQQEDLTIVAMAEWMLSDDLS